MKINRGLKSARFVPKMFDAGKVMQGPARPAHPVAGRSLNARGRCLFDMTSTSNPFNSHIPDGPFLTCPFLAFFPLEILSPNSFISLDRQSIQAKMPPSADPYQDDTADATATEATPLLAGETATTTDRNGKATPNNVDENTEDEQMPYTQILLLCYASLAEPVAYFSIFPFINAMIESTGGIPESSVGFYSGLIESLFSLVQMVLMIFYGRMSDRLGRKPILVFSLCGVSIATALFGMSKTLWQMIMFRCLAGVFAGSVVTIRTMLSENTGKKTQGRAFAWYMFTRNLGIFLGPLVGGGLANPADQFPGTFGDVQFFVDYPYALPTFVAGAICMTGTLSSLFFLKEVCHLSQHMLYHANNLSDTPPNSYGFGHSRRTTPFDTPSPPLSWSPHGPLHLRSHHASRISLHSRLPSLPIHLNRQRRPLLHTSPDLPLPRIGWLLPSPLDASRFPIPSVPHWNGSSPSHMRSGLA